MTKIVSTNNLSKTKLERKPDYEEIISIVEPDIRPRVPKRRANEQYRSHFNMVYTNISDERMREIEKDMLL